MCYFDFEFLDAEQEKFFHDIVTELVITDPATEEAVYLLTLFPELRIHFWEMFGYRARAIVDECPAAKWQTDKTRRLISMARKLEHMHN